MLTKRHIFTAIAATMLSFSMLSGGAVTADAQSWGGRLSSDSQQSISAAEAKAIARRHVPGGEVVDIKRRGDTYSVRVIKRGGKVVDVLIDANTGRVK